MEVGTERQRHRNRPGPSGCVIAEVYIYKRWRTAVADKLENGRSISYLHCEVNKEQPAGREFLRMQTLSCIVEGTKTCTPASQCPTNLVCCTEQQHVQKLARPASAPKTLHATLVVFIRRPTGCRMTHGPWGPVTWCLLTQRYELLMARACNLLVRSCAHYLDSPCISSECGEPGSQMGYRAHGLS